MHPYVHFFVPETSLRLGISFSDFSSLTRQRVCRAATANVYAYICCVLVTGQTRDAGGVAPRQRAGGIGDLVVGVRIVGQASSGVGWMPVQSHVVNCMAVIVPLSVATSWVLMSLHLETGFATIKGKTGSGFC